jgi:hypothetical protein
LLPPSSGQWSLPPPPPKAAGFDSLAEVVYCGLLVRMSPGDRISWVVSSRGFPQSLTTNTGTIL